MAVTQWLRNCMLPRVVFCVAALLLFNSHDANAAFLNYYDVDNFTFSNNNADGSRYVSGPGVQLLLMGGNNGSGAPGYTDLTIAAPAAGTVNFTYEYLTFDDPGFDWAGYLHNGLFTQLAAMDGDFGSVTFAVARGDVFGFRVETDDNTGFPAELYIGNFDAPQPLSGVPEPGAGVLVLIGIASIVVSRLWKRKQHWAAGLVVVLGCGTLNAQQAQRSFTGTDITGRLQLVRTVNATHAAELARLAPLGARFAPALKVPEFKSPKRLLRPESGLRALGAVTPPSAVAVSQLLSVLPSPAGTGFPAINHYDQRMASRGNQYSVEPPNPSVAAANGYVLVGVNNAVAIYSTAGTPLLPTILSSNELFGVPPAIDRTSGINGPFPTDMRVFFDHSINRWFVLQRAQDYDIYGDPMTSSRIYLAVSQTPNPLANYTIYEINTTNYPEINGCPCYSDYPQIGADQYGFYISVNEFNSLTNGYVVSSILAVSKAALAASAPLPTTYKFTLPPALTSSGYEFTIHPATTPPGASYFVGMGGLQYFVSTNVISNRENSLGIWALYNTMSLNSPNPAPTLVQTSLTTIPFVTPTVALQKPGPNPYGSSLGFPVAAIEAGDNRVQAVTYAGSRLYVTVASQVLDDASRRVTGTAYVVLSPVFRSGALGVSVVRQGYLAVSNNHLLRPAIAVNAQGKGAIAMTLVGSGYYPSAAFVPVNVYPDTATLYLAAAGVAPQDGFSGYEGFPARWGDYSTATVAPDGSVWMITQYIPGPRSEAANWGTYVKRYVP